MKISRRRVLKGLGGVSLGLPLLESLLPRSLAALAPQTEPFAIFLRQANGVAQAQNTDEIGAEPERFWPHQLGALDATTLADRALDELVDYADRLLVVRNVNMEEFPYGDGHARGALQALTAQGPTVAGAGGNAEANGESLDHRIGRELNPDGRDSLFLYSGVEGGWLGGPCISYRGPGNRRSALTSAYAAYQTIVGGDQGMSEQAAQQLAQRQLSVNDLVRDELEALLAQGALGSSDRERLQLHLASVRDLEVALGCQLALEQEQALAAAQDYDTSDGNDVLAQARLQLDVAALAVACGHTRSVVLQIGNGNDGDTSYYDTTTGQQLENYHYISHRRASHDSNGAVIMNSDLLHHIIDRQFAQTFKYLLDRLAAYQVPGGALLDAGVAVWFNDLGNGPGHSRQRCPFILAGSANGFFKQGQYLALLDDADGTPNHARLLNTIGSAVGLRSPSGDLISDFGDPSLDRSPLGELMA